MKKLWIGLVLSLLVFVLLPTSAKAEAEGDFEYSVEDGEATITKYNGTGPDVVIPSDLGGYPVTSIGSAVFYNNKDITSITLPATLKSIGGAAFQAASNLKKVYISDLSSWCRISFEDMYSTPTCLGDLYLNGELLTSVSIPSGIEEIKDYTFYYCSSLTSVIIPESVTSIGNSAFCSCTSLSSITIPESVTSIGSGAFAICENLTSIIIPEGVTSIEQLTFFGCKKLTSIIIPEGVTSIGRAAFCICNILTSITIPGSVTSIGNDALTNTNLSEVTFMNTKEKWENLEPNNFIDNVNSVTVIFKPRITFLDDDGQTVLYLSNDVYGAPTVYGGTTPKKQDDAKYTYSFAGWNDGTNSYGLSDTLPVIQGEATYTAIYISEVRKYKITFMDDDGNTVLYSSDVAYDEKPEYKGNPIPPVKEPDAQYTYTFAGWQMGNGPVCENDSLPTVTGETTYTATYISKLREYEIKFIDEKGKELQSGKVAYGDTPSYTGEAPTKDKTAQYTYTFAGWNDGTNTYGLSDTIPAVKGDATYTVVFDSTINEYEIKFMDEEGKELQSSKVSYGEMPEYKGETPTKEATDQYTYTFSWDKEIAKVTGDAIYTVTFKETIRKYTITFVNEDGSLLQSGEVAYGEIPKYTGDTPTKAETAEATYPFVGWKANDGSVYYEGKSLLPAVTGDAIYNALLPALLKVNYSPSQGSEINWTQGSSDGVAITIKRSVDDANCFSHYLETLIDKTATNVSAESGSTIITISAETLEKLSVGEHTILVKFDDGEAEIKLTIKAKPAENNTPSKGTNTGDSNHPVLWISLMSLALIGIGAIVLFRKKRMN